MNQKDASKTDEQQGLYEKYDVVRTDGSSLPGGKHAGCEYFVLDLTHDKHAVAALEAYANSCRREYPVLAADLKQRVVEMAPRLGVSQSVKL